MEIDDSGSNGSRAPVWANPLGIVLPAKPTDGTSKTTMAKPSASDNPENSLFEIKTDRDSRAATGWRTTDGRIVTKYSAIAGCGEIFALQDGKSYRLGKKISIDDINDIAVLSFVDEAPPAKGLSTGRNYVLGERVKATANREEQTKHGRLSNVIKREDIFHGSLLLPVNSSTLTDARLFATTNLIETTNLHSAWIGSPVVNRDGLVIGMMDTNPGKSDSQYLTPVQKINDLLAQKSDQSKFTVHTGYESGFGKYFRDWNRSPGRAAFASLEPAGRLVGTLLFAQNPAGYPSNASLTIGLAAITALTGYRTYKDYQGFTGATNGRDTAYYSNALVGDAGALLGVGLGWASLLYPKLRAASVSLALSGTLVRLWSEVIPNKFVVKDIERRDGTNRPPFSPVHYRHR
jgi:S1-C subfamily serine protease